MMQGHWEKEARERESRYLARKFGLTHGAVSLGLHEIATGVMVRQSRLPMGRPVIIQDAIGNTTYLPGMDGPLS